MSEKILAGYEGFFFTLRVVQEWNWLPREVVSFPSLAIFKEQLDKHLSWML